MAFEKGHAGFKPKGSIHEKTKQWALLGESIVTEHTERFNNILRTCDDEEFIKYYTGVLEFFKPKLGRTETKVEGEVVTIIKFRDAE